MNIIKKSLAFIAACTLAVSAAATEKVIVAYVTSWSDVLPDPAAVTHINYAFGHVNETFDGVGIANPERLAKVVAVKQQAPELKVALSVGGWGSGRFSEMADNDSLRASFAADCRRVVDEYGLDGIDIDWEYPTQSSAGISACERDTDNFTLLMRDLRKALGPDKLLTIATPAGAEFFNFRDFIPYVDFVNTMTYDMANAPKHHAALYPSANTEELCCDESIRRHIAAGVPASKLVMGVPFYGRGGTELRGRDFRNIAEGDGYVLRYDSVARVPYMANAKGELVLGYDDARSMAEKCGYMLDNELHGVMYWDYAGDDDKGTLRNTIANIIKGQNDKPKILVLNEGGGQHGPFTAAAMKWLRNYAAAKGYGVTEIRDARPITADFLRGYALVIQLDFPPYTWPEAAVNAFEEYIDNGLGGWIGLHHATLLGEFDGYGLWNWFSDFMGGITFKNYIAPTADGKVTVEDTAHPVMAGLPADFVLPKDEWYTYDHSPRANVQVLASVDEDTYTPASDVRMGDHPVVWVNPAKKARNVYIQPGHHPELIDTPAFTQLLANAIEWTIANPETSGK
ncbi:MAG: ThuA domain-containing protein [Muribaculaceae bacterium]|nr:ThuA domain-containing protein [Muribaculaceae bacterium]